MDDRNDACREETFEEVPVSSILELAGMIGQRVDFDKKGSFSFDDKVMLAHVLVSVPRTDKDGVVIPAEICARQQIRIRLFRYGTLRIENKFDWMRVCEMVSAGCFCRVVFSWVAREQMEAVFPPRPSVGITTVDCRKLSNRLHQRVQTIVSAKDSGGNGHENETALQNDEPGGLRDHDNGGLIGRRVEVANIPIPPPLVILAKVPASSVASETVVCAEVVKDTATCPPVQVGLPVMDKVVRIPDEM